MNFVCVWDIGDMLFFFVASSSFHTSCQMGAFNSLRGISTRSDTSAVNVLSPLKHLCWLGRVANGSWKGFPISPLWQSWYL